MSCHVKSPVFSTSVFSTSRFSASGLGQLVLAEDLLEDFCLTFPLPARASQSPFLCFTDTDLSRQSRTSPSCPAACPPPTSLAWCALSSPSSPRQHLSTFWVGIKMRKGRLKKKPRKVGQSAQPVNRNFFIALKWPTCSETWNKAIKKFLTPPPPPTSPEQWSRWI